MQIWNHATEWSIMKGGKGFLGIRQHFASDSTAHSDGKCIWQNSWLSFPNGMVFVQWCDLQWEAPYGLQKEKKQIFLIYSGTPPCIIQSEAGFRLRASLAPNVFATWRWSWETRQPLWLTSCEVPKVRTEQQKLAHFWKPPLFYTRRPA